MKTHAFVLAVLLLTRTAPAATQVNIPTPPGSGEFGTSVTVLPNGNFVVTDPGFDQISPPVANVGAVYLYNPDGLLISTLIGSTTNDEVGINGATLLANGHFVVRSPNWNGTRGAATWGSAATGFIGGPSVVVSAANSLVGSSPDDSVGNTGLTALTNGNYVVRSTVWDNTAPAASNAGAVTWGSGATGIIGPVTAANSLVGSSPNDNLGSNGVTALTNGNYLVRSQNWDNPATAAADVGAVTWASGTTGVSGPVSAANSLVGSSPDDRVGSSGVTALTNGNYVVRSSSWANPAPAAANAGAATWGSGTTGITGPVSAANSLVGSSLNDQVGGTGVTALTNGNYVVRSQNWDNTAPLAANAGAVTWASGTTGATGPVSAANSLVGSSLNDNVGNSGVTALTNGNYVVNSFNWDNPATATADAGAATWGSGTSGVNGPVTAANSLVGSSPGDNVGSHGVNALTNGNYVVRSSNWDNPATNGNVGAVTWGNGTTGIAGPVSTANSLVGSSLFDHAGLGLIALSNGNYVVISPDWDNPAAAASNAGAATWGNGSKGSKGTVSAANSLVGSSSNDNVGSGGVIPLTNGNYVVNSQNWDNPAPASANAGAVTWGSGTTGITGPVSPANSLVGSSLNDQVGGTGVTALTNGNYVVRSPFWNNPAPTAANAGAATWGSGTTGITGPLSATNSLVGSTANDQVGSGGVIPLTNGHYIEHSSLWDNPASAAFSAGAVSLGNGFTGTAGQVSSATGVLGTVAGGGSGLVSAYDPARHQLIVGQPNSNLVTRFIGDQLRSLGLSSQPAPGASDIAYAKPGTAAVNASGNTLADFSLSGSGSSSGRNRALFAFSPTFGTDLVLQSGTPLSVLGSGLPANTTATTLLSPLFNRATLGLFQATVKGTGITPANNRLLLLDNGASVQLLHRTGTPIGVGALATATLSSFTEVLQSHDQDLITLAYKLKSGGTVTAASDEGLLFLNHIGAVSTNIAAREGQPAFGGGGDFGAFTGRAAAGLGSVIHFTALFKPTGLKPLPAVFSTTLNGFTTARLAKSGDPAPSSGGATFNTFTALSHQTGSAVFKATLKGSPASQNEALYRLPAPALLTRKGDPVGGGLNIARIIRFWPAGPGQVILHAQVTGTNANASNNQVLLLRQSDNTYLTLLRTGTPAPGTGPAKLAALSAIDVNPVTGRYAVLGTLSGSPATSNQALWTGDPTLGDNSPALQVLRLPQLTLRKGNPYTTAATPNGLIRSIALKPAIDPTGAGGRGLAQALGATGDLALFITTDRNLTELVLLDR